MSENRIARRGVLHPIKLSRKPAKIVNRSRRRAYRDAGFWNEPMRGYGENSLRLLNLLPHPRPSFGIGIIEQSIHRTAVPKEDRWLYIHLGPRASVSPLNFPTLRGSMLWASWSDGFEIPIKV